MSIRLNKISAADWILAVFLTCFTITRIIHMPVMIANMIPASCGLFALFWLLIKKTAYIGNAFLICFFLTAFMGLSILFNNNCNIWDIIWIWCYMGIAMLIFSCKINPGFIMFQYCCFITYLFFKMVCGISNASILSIGSQNNISVYLLLYICLYLIAQDNDEPITAIIFIAIFLGFIVSAWSASRAGILAFAFLVAFLFVYNILKTEKKIKTIFVGGILIIVLYFLLDKCLLSFMIGLKNKFNNYGNSSLRTEIWKEYLLSSTKNIGSFLFGPNTMDENYTWLSYYSGNTHNSFLMLHSHFGLLPFFVILILLIKNLAELFKNNLTISGIAFGSLILRSFFDWTAFPGVYDIFFFLMIIVTLNEYFYRNELEIY